MATSAELLQKFNDDLLSTYAKIGEKGGTVPENKNSDNLTSAVDSIPQEGGGGGGDALPLVGDYGKITTTSGQEIPVTSLTDYLSLVCVYDPTNYSYISPSFHVSGQLLYSWDFKAYEWGKDCKIVPEFFLAGTSIQELRGKCLVSYLPKGFLASGGRQADYTNASGQLTTLGDLTSVEKVGNFFLAGQGQFNEPLNLPNLKEIGDDVNGGYFLYCCTGFNQSVNDILRQIPNVHRYFLKYCSAFNQPVTIPNTSTMQLGDGMEFMNYCTEFNSQVTFEEGLTAIPSNFMAHCEKFNQPITLPNSLTSFSSGFLMSCYSFTGPLNVGSATAPTSIDISSLASDRLDVDLIRIGVVLTGENAEAWGKALPSAPNASNKGYRRTFVGARVASDMEKFAEAVKAGTAKSTYPVGTKLAETIHGGTTANWIVVQYLDEDSENYQKYGWTYGAILMLDTSISESGVAWGFSANNNFATACSQYYNVTSKNISGELSIGSLPYFGKLYVPYWDGTEWGSQENVLFFPPSVTELWGVNQHEQCDGAPFDYFKNGIGGSPTDTAADFRAFVSSNYWTRTPVNAEGSQIYSIKSGAVTASAVGQGTRLSIPVCAFVPRN